jgi:predicted porin
MAAGNSAVITLTDGNITYKLGNAAHLSTAEKTVSGPMDGSQDAEARVDAFDGFSVGLGIGPGTLTVAIDEESGTETDALGDLNMYIACGGNSLSYGINFTGDVGAAVSFTYGSGSATANPKSCNNAAEGGSADNDSQKSNSATANTMGLGVAVPIGGMSLALDYESSGTTNKEGASGTSVETKTAQSGFEVSFTMPIADATLGVNVSAHSTETTVAGTKTALGAQAGTEVWYSVPIGAVTLAVGYGSSASATGCSTCTAGTTVTSKVITQMGAEMSMSF